MKDDPETLRQIEAHLRLIAWVVNFWFWAGIVGAGILAITFAKRGGWI
jgi:hypothetical protein